MQDLYSQPYYLVRLIQDMLTQPCRFEEFQTLTLLASSRGPNLRRMTLCEVPGFTLYED